MRLFSTHSADRARRDTERSPGITKPKDRWLGDTFSWLLPDAGEHITYPPAPDGKLIYVIGDIHGRIDLLEALCARIDRDLRDERSTEVLEIYVGDYVDRGPASEKVIARLIRRKKERTTVFLRGNHEKVLQDFFSGQATLDEWCQIGGLETLLSYGVDPDLLRHPDDADSVREALIERMPDSHRAFLNELQTFYRAGAYFFVHAGVRPGIALEQQDEHDCLWIREEFLEHEDPFGCIVVHGHSPASAPELLPNRINLDTAAYATGHLSCLKISQQGARLLETDPAEGIAINS